jgi:hypothetical protein
MIPLAYVVCAVVFVPPAPHCTMRLGFAPPHVCTHVCISPYPCDLKGLYPSMPLGLAGLQELIRHRPPTAAAGRPFYSNFDWLDYGLILLVN